jgi:hypothetical protein
MRSVNGRMGHEEMDLREMGDERSGLAHQMTKQDIERQSEDDAETAEHGHLLP